MLVTVRHVDGLKHIRAFKVEPREVLKSNIRILSLPGNVRLGWKGLEVTNALAYYVAVALL